MFKIKQKTHICKPNNRNISAEWNHVCNKVLELDIKTFKHSNTTGMYLICPIKGLTLAAELPPCNWKCLKTNKNLTKK